MANKIYSLFFTTFALLFSCLGLASDNRTSISLDTSAETISAGQQVELALTVRYNEGVEAVFRAPDQNWGDMELLATQLSSPRWVDEKWQQIIYMDATFLMPDSHQTPEFTVDFFQDSEHWQQTSQSLPIKVVTVFDNQSVDLYGTVELPKSRTVSSSSIKTLLVLAALFAGITTLIIRKYKTSSLPPLSTPPSATELAETALTTGSTNWEALRQWLMKTTGADPTGKLTTHEPLLYRYQSLRFSKDTSLQDFVELCNHCQERWG